MLRRRTGKEATSRSKSESSPLLFGASGSPTATASSSSTRRLFKGQKQGKKSKVRDPLFALPWGGEGSTHWF